MKRCRPARRRPWPDLRTSRRFIAVEKTMMATATTTPLPCTKPKTVPAFCTPELTETATVST